MSVLSNLRSFNQQFIFGLCAFSMLYNPNQVVAQADVDNYVAEQPSGYSQPALIGGVAVLGAAAGAITAACISHGHHGHKGDRGPRGAPGPNGTIGGNGANGATGPAGPTGSIFIADPNPAATFTVDFNVDGFTDPGITFTPFIIYPDGTIQEGLIGGSIASITTAFPLIYGSYTIGLRILVPSIILTTEGEVTPIVTSSTNGAVYQLPSYIINVPGAQFSPGYMFTTEYEYPNPATPFILP